LTAGATPAVAGTTTPGPTDFLGWVNNLRATVNDAPLVSDATLTSVAQQWANHMAGTESLTHNPSLSTQAPSGWTKMGENIGEGFSLSAVYNALVGSPTHYANMVDQTYNRTGVGVATDANGQVWVAEDFGDYPPPTPATMVFPANGDRIFASAQAFSWAMSPGANYYLLTVGFTQGSYELLNSGVLLNTQLSYPVPAMPGGPLWVRIYTYTQGAWIWTDASISVVGPTTATFTQPTAGAANVSTAQPFTWSPIPGATYYVMTVGTTVGAYDLFLSQLMPASQTSDAVPALPTGRTLWARIYSYMGGAWRSSDISFTAAAR
jgi:hypothetical protein